MFQPLHMAQYPSTVSITKAVVNLTDTLLDDATHLTLLKGLNFANLQPVLPIEDILGGADKAISMLPVEAAETGN
jgi:hypothetical protein